MSRSQSSQVTGAVLLFQKNVPIKECAEIAGVSVASIYRALKRMGIELPSQKPFIAHKKIPPSSG